VLAFIDESGKPHPKDSTMNPILCCVCIKESDIKYISQRIYQLKTKIFQNDSEIKSTSLINRRIFLKNLTKNKQYVDEFVKAACSFDIKVFAIIMEKPNLPIALSEKLLPKHFKLLVKRIEFFCEKYGHEKAILVFDGINMKEDYIVSKCITNFLFMSKYGKGFHHILEMPFFVSSEVTPAIQIADIFAGIIRHYYENGLDITVQNKDEFEIWIRSLFTQIVNKTEDILSPSAKYPEYGFYKMGKNF